MSERSALRLMRRLGQELGGGSLPRIWGRRSFWQIRLRWWVPPTLFVAVLAARSVGYELAVAPVLLVALGILAYNAMLSLGVRRLGVNLEREGKRDRRWAIVEVALDYAAMFLLIGFTGGVGSPLITFFLFHVIFAAIQFSGATTYLFAGVSLFGLWLMALLQLEGLLVCPVLAFRGQALDLIGSPGHLLAVLLIFSATMITTAMLTTRIMGRFRSRVQALTRATDQVAALNERFHSLYTMLSAVGSQHRLQPILDFVCRELALVMNVRVVAVKLLSDDRLTLRFVAAHGLSPEFLAANVVQLAASPLNRRVIEGETLVQGNVDTQAAFQLHDELRAAGIRSVAFAPLRLVHGVIGILGAYCEVPNRFSKDDTAFLRLAAELVAVAIENARSYEAAQTLLDERARFMLRVTHNMRSPLAASLSLLTLLREGVLGLVPPKQDEFLERIEHRLRNLNQVIGELLTLSRGREPGHEFPPERLEPGPLAERLRDDFAEQATAKSLQFRVFCAEGLPAILAHDEALRQVLENLVSNAVKYTPAGGEVTVDFQLSPEGGLRVEVADTGIGIPAGEQGRLFGEFFRASNARALAEEGTGLGLALVKQTVERYGGTLRLASEEGVGTTVVMDLPAAR